MRRARDDLEPAADEVAELARPRRAAPIDDQRLDLLIAGAERHAVPARIGDGEARRADLSFAGHEIRKHLVIDIDAEADAELGGVAAGELVLDAARLVGPVIEGGRRIARDHPQLAGTQDALENRGWRRARAEHCAQHMAASIRNGGFPCAESNDYTGIGARDRSIPASVL